MATLVLSSAGNAIAGPLGASVGRIFGQQIDRSFRGGGSYGRLSDLRVQTSQYGSEIPAIYGRMRVAGTIIWASDLVESSVASKTGSQHSYTVSFAIALSSRPVVEIGRVWADGRLIRGAAGDNKIPFVLRLHQGREDQLPDPLIASFVGAENAPAYRGLALAVFEDFDLSTFGSRLPQITIELDTEDEPVGPSMLVSRIAGVEGETGSSIELVSGFAVQGDTRAEVVHQVSSLFDVPFVMTEDGWRVGRGGDVHVIAPEEIGRGEGGRRLSVVAAEHDLPSKVSVRYYDPTLDFAAGEQSARLPGPERLRRIEIAGVMNGNDAKTLAHRLLTSAWNSRRLVRLALPVSYAKIALGDRLQISGEGGAPLRVVAKSIQKGQLECLLARSEEEEVAVNAVAPLQVGLRSQALDVPSVPLKVALVELPVTSGTDAAMAIVAAGGPVPWRPVPLQVAIGGTLREMLAPRLPGGLGALTSPLPAGPADIFDECNDLNVVLECDVPLESVIDEALLAGANLISVDSELMQFGRAEYLGERRYRLSRLLRGRFGSKCQCEHSAGTQFVLLAPDRMATLTIPIDMAGAPVSLRAFDFNDGEAAVSGVFQAKALRPWAPVHLSSERRHGDFVLHWIRRSRLTSAWLDHVDVPLGELKEVYRVQLAGVAGTLLLETDTPTITIAAEDLNRLGAKPWSAEVRQVGDWGISDPVVLQIN